MKPLIIILFIALCVPLFCQSWEDMQTIINSVPVANRTNILAAMPDWSENFSIDEDFNVTDLAKYRWIGCGTTYEDLVFQFYLPPSDKIYKALYTDINYKTKFRIVAEIDGKLMGAPLSEQDVELFQNGIYIEPPFISYITNLVPLRTLQGEYVKPDLLPGVFYYYEGDRPPQACYSVQQIKTGDYTGSVVFSNVNYEHYRQLEAGSHLITYDSEKHEFRSDGTIGCYLDNQTVLANDAFIIRILSFNENIKLLQLETPYYSCTYVPIEDYFVPGTNLQLETVSKRYKQSRLDFSGPFYSEPDFTAEQYMSKSFIENEFYHISDLLILDISTIFEEHNGIISKWIYAREKEPLAESTEGWIWGGDIRKSNSIYYYNFDLRYHMYNVKKNINKSATLNDTRVRCRAQPNLNCDTQGFFNLGDKVTVLYKSLDPSEIDGESWYWYLVRSETLPDGWVYGKYLDIEE